ncbi:ATP-binding cassette, subfamily B [Paenibacillus sp. 1_12]|uniref:ABC transporter ATP-binding protein n=1 Tax=Paenibacillus sp. 1_12 TaxID=1566278 RepID=UPI0008E879BD|nr:ABC transporter ATP-binding protein [Paenibacillus sp. 1_12]SFL58598.1 ATP-binding cassette, subfamily B [Paenibacillus sp. 1_12]
MEIQALIKQYVIHPQRVYFWILTYLTSYYALLIMLVGSGVLIASAELAIPKYVEAFIDWVIPSKDNELFGTMFLGLSALLFILVCATAWKNTLQRNLQEKASRDLLESMLIHLNLLGVAYSDRHPTGETFSLFHTEIAAAQTIFKQHLPAMIQSFITFLFSVLVLYKIQPIFVLIIGGCFLTFYVLGPYFLRKTNTYSKEAAANRTTLQKKLYDSVSSLLEVRSYSAQEWDQRLFRAKEEALHRSELKRQLYWLMRWLWRKVTINIGLIITCIYGISMVYAERMTVGEFTAVFTIYFIMMDGLIELVTSFMEQSLLLHQVERLYQFMHEEPEVKENHKAVVLPKIRGDLQYKNVHFHYHSEDTVLQGLDLKVCAGEKVVIVGRSGNGKSTLLKLLGRFYDPSHGYIGLDGVQLDQISIHQLRDAIGYVFQETYLFGTTIRDNIRFGKIEATDEDILKAAKAAYAHEFIEKLPLGYDTFIGERGIKLSGGQKQRIAIARMFIKDPAILLLDEATSALDNSSEKEVNDALHTLMEGRTTITVAHRLSTIRSYDRIVVLEAGRVIEDGPYESLIKKKGYFFQLIEGEKEDKQ